MALINYEDKVALNINPDIPDFNKVNASDMNEIKRVVNLNSEKNIITAYSDEIFTNPSSSSYNKISLNSYEKIGTKLTLNNNSEVVVGSGISKVLVSGTIVMPGNNMSAGGKNFVIRKNGSIVSRVWWYVATAYNSNETISPKLISVQENDKIDMAYYGTNGDQIVGIPYSNLTVEGFE